MRASVKAALGAALVGVSARALARRRASRGGPRPAPDVTSAYDTSESFRRATQPELAGPRKTYHHEIDIEAPPKVVWDVLTDTAAWPRWNPLWRSAEGELAPGSKWTVQLGGNRMRSKVQYELLVVDPPREIRGITRYKPARLFQVERYCRLEPSDGGTRFIQGEVCTGPLVPAVFAMLGSDLVDRAYAGMMRGLKARAEGMARS